MANDFSSLTGYGTKPDIDLLNPYQITDLAPLTQASNAAGGGLAGLSSVPLDATTAGWGAGIGDWLKNSGFLGSTGADGIKTQGWGAPALGVAQGLGNAFLSMKQYGLAKDTFNENKRQFALNFGAQQKTTNARLEDRQAARIASNPTAYQSVGDYMKKYGV